MKILIELTGRSTIGGPCPGKNCNKRIDQARGRNGKLECKSEGKASNWCEKCGTHVVWEDGQWQVSQVRNRLGDLLDHTLRVISWVCSEDLVDSDAMCMDSWTKENPLPCYFIGGWCDGFNFLGVDHHIAVDQNCNPQRHSFTFNFVPKTLADVEKAIAKWAAV